MPNEWDARPPDDDEEEIGPDHPDYDLSEAHGYGWEPAREQEVQISGAEVVRLVTGQPVRTGRERWTCE